MKKNSSKSFYTCATQVLHPFLLLHGCWDEDFLAPEPLQIYIVSNSPFNLTAAAEVLIVNTFDVSMNVCDDCTRRACRCVYV